ncbi:MAG: hypothetical protein HFJ17_02685 [Clostridia bacterium]|nr:hypothetical protein [Clostridia bacterium]
MKNLKLYGIITEIIPQGDVAICEPVYVDYWSKTPTQFFHIVTETQREPCNIDGFASVKSYRIEEVDINQFGKPLFLPVGKNKIQDGKKYFILFQANKCECASKFYGSYSVYFHEQADIINSESTFFANFAFKSPDKILIGPMTKGVIITDAKHIEKNIEAAKSGINYSELISF